MPHDEVVPLPAASAVREEVVDGAAVLHKVAWRLIPFLCLLYIFNILDRNNVGFARITMEQELGMSQAVFDLGTGIFYFGYLAFEVPANLLLQLVGARRWIARIMITWGMVSCATMLVTGPVGFYLVRILLGVAEAGFFPGIVLYLTYWFPTHLRARMMSLFMMAIPMAGVFGNPISGAIMQYLEGAGGLAGWQWLFLLEGLPSIVLGLVVLAYLPDGPHKASWLRGHERTWLQSQLDREAQARAHPQGKNWMATLIEPRVWLLIAIYFTVAVGSNASGSYFPRLIGQQFQEASKMQIGLLSALPHVSAVVCMVLIAISSDRTGGHSVHVAFAALLAAVGWSIAAAADHPWLALAGLCLAQAGMMSMLPPFWALPTSFLTGTAAAAGIALINSVANVGGLFGPAILGWLGLPAMAIILLGGALLALLVRPAPRPSTSE
ncbi:MAG: MFS transporter [Gemmataceae bacterium]